METYVKINFFLYLPTIQLLKMTSICAECGASVASMPQHMKAHDKRKFECEVCDKLVVGRTNFVNHKQTHKTWTCPLCHN